MEQKESDLETLLNCPVCEQTIFSDFLECIDFTVSKEKFKIVECNSCGFKFTNPRPKETQIDKYYQSADYISHSNISKGLINRLYQIARKFTISRKVNFIRSIMPGNSILDYGCGTGEFLNGMKKKGWKAVGIEPSSHARALAIKNYDLEVFEFIQNQDLINARFDIITLWHVLEHIHNLNQMIAVLKKMLNKQGKLIVAVPNSNSADAKFYKEFWAAYDVPRHLSHFNYYSVEKLFKKHAMKIIKTLPMPLDSFYVAMLSEKYKNSSIGMLKGVVNGFKANIKSIRNKNLSSSLIFVIEKSID